MMIQPVHSLTCCSPTKAYNSQPQQNPTLQQNKAAQPAFTGWLSSALAKALEKVLGLI